MSLDHPKSAFELPTLRNNCLLCNLLFDIVQRNYSGDYQQVPIIRDNLALAVTINGPCIIRLCADLGSSLPSFNIFNYVAYYFMLIKEPSTNGSYSIKIGPPILQTINLFQIRSTLYF
jgi:hypothetical protein